MRHFLPTGAVATGSSSQQEPMCSLSPGSPFPPQPRGFQMKDKFPVLLISLLSLGYVPFPLEWCPQGRIKTHFFQKRGGCWKLSPHGRRCPSPDLSPQARSRLGPALPVGFLNVQGSDLTAVPGENASTPSSQGARRAVVGTGPRLATAAPGPRLSRPRHPAG